MRTVWNLIAHNRDYRLLLLASLVSQGGDWILGIGMTFYVYSVTGSTLASGTMVVAAMLPQLVLGSVAGVFVDRWDRRRTMVGANVLLAGSLTPLVFVHGAGQLWIIYLTVVVQNSVVSFFVPAEAAFVPRLVSADDLIAANALNGQNSQIARLVGSALGGVLAVTGGIFAVAMVDLASYLVAAVLIMLIRTRVPARRIVRGPVTMIGRWRRTRTEWVAGLRLCRDRPDLSALLSFGIMSRLGEGVFSALLVPFVIGVLGAGSAQYGVVMSAQAVGGIVGGIAVAVFATRVRSSPLLGYGALLFGVLDLLIAVYPVALPKLWPIFVLIGLVGLPAAAMNAGYATSQQQRVPDEYRGRVFGAISAAAAVSMILGTVLASTLAGVVGIIPIIALQGGIHIVAGPLVLARLRRADAAPAPLAESLLPEESPL